MKHDLPDATPDKLLLAKCASFADAMELARRRIPKFLFDYLSGGCNGEWGMARNQQAMNDITLTPRYGVDLANVDTTTTLFDRTWSVPIGVAPVGFAGSFWPDAERAMAAAAARHRLPYVASTVTVLPIEDIAAAGDGNVWFQLYMFEDRAINDDILKRVRSAGIDTLIVTVDVPTYSKRCRDARNQLGFPIRIKPLHLLQMVMRPAWTFASALRIKPDIGNLMPYVSSRSEAADQLTGYMGARNTVSWKHLEGLRSDWPGKFLVKGIMHEADAEKCIELGADGIVVSNHGGRQFDAAPATISKLPAIAKVASGRAAVILDSGIRTGGDVLRALALGADFCLAGRAFYWTAAGLGDKGPDHAMRLFRSEIHTAFCQAGVVDTRNRSALSDLAVSSAWKAPAKARRQSGSNRKRVPET